MDQYEVDAVKPAWQMLIFDYVKRRIPMAVAREHAAQVCTEVAWREGSHLAAGVRRVVATSSDGVRRG